MTATSNLQVWDMYKKAEASFWTAEELDLAHDLKVSNCTSGADVGGTTCRWQPFEGVLGRMRTWWFVRGKTPRAPIRPRPRGDATGM